MALTSSVSTAPGSTVPHFSLPDAHGKHYSLEDFAAAPVLIVAFWCNHCPYVRHIKSAFAAFVKDYQPKGVGIVAINSNDFANYPHDSPEKMREDIEAFDYRFPYLVDESQEVARRFDAACTPDIFVYDGERRLAYHGQFDASRPGNDETVDGRDLRAAVDALLAGACAPREQTACIGCSIKWR